MSGPGYWDGLAVAIAADRALIGPPAAALLLHLATLAETKARRNGVYVANQPHLQHVLEVLELVAGRADHVGAGHPDVRGAASLEPSSMRGPAMTVREASVFLGLSDRQVRRLAEDGRFGLAPLVKGRRQLSRAAVIAHNHHHRDNTQEKR